MIENGGFGATIAGPIASLMIEKYLRRKITKVDFEKRMLEGSLKGQYDKLYPRKHQDSLALMNSKIKDSLAKVKNTKDTISVKKDKKETKLDTVKR